MFALVILASSCAVGAPLPQPSPDEQRAIDAAVAAWELAGREACNGVAGLWHAVDDDEYSALCAGAGWQRSSACYVADAELIVLRAGTEMDEVGEPVVHETLHALKHCSGHPDHEHADPVVWAASGGDETVQRWAQRLFAAD